MWWSPSMTRDRARRRPRPASPADAPDRACERETVAAADGTEQRHQPRGRQQRARRGLRLVGADRQRPAVLGQAPQRGLDAGEQPAVDRDMGGVVGGKRRQRVLIRRHDHGRRRRGRPARPRRRRPWRRPAVMVKTGKRARAASGGSARRRYPARCRPACRRDPAAGFAPRCRTPKRELKQ